jgi:hypothetical protein
MLTKSGKVSPSVKMGCIAAYPDTKLLVGMKTTPVDGMELSHMTRLLSILEADR